MDCNLKKLGQFLQVYRFCLGQRAETVIMVYSLFENSLDMVLSMFYKHVVYDKGT